MTLTIATLNRFESRLQRYQHHLSRVTTVVLALMGFAYPCGPSESGAASFKAFVRASR